MIFNHNNYIKVDDEHAAHCDRIVVVQWQCTKYSEAKCLDLCSYVILVANCHPLPETNSIHFCFIFVHGTYHHMLHILLTYPQLECKLCEGKDFLLLCSLLSHCCLGKQLSLFE